MTKVGIIGCGVIAPTHIEGYRLLPGVEVVHLSDLKPERMAEKGDKYGIVKRSCDYRELLADPERLLAAVPEGVRAFLQNARFAENYRRILANTPRDPASRSRAFHRWFDGLRTLRLLHALAPEK